MAPLRYLVVGLGNPGAEYAGTRHNIGFMAVDALADAATASSWQRKFKGQIATASLADHNVILLKPMTFMNLSGESVGAALNFYKLAPTDVIVFHDDIDLQPGQVKVKQGGGHAGHNGLRSLDEHIGKDYWRVRLGIGRPENKDEVHDYVLHNFARADKAWLAPLLDTVTEFFPLLLQGKKDRFLKHLAEQEADHA